MPASLFGLVVFAAAVGPGHVFLRIAERWTPRSDRSTLREAAELVVVGATSTAIALLVVVSLGNWTGFLDPEQIVANRTTYIVREPVSSLVVLLLVLALSYGAAAICAYLIYTPLRVPRSQRKHHRPNDTIWYSALSRDLPDGHAVWATVEMGDRRQISGLLRAFPTHEKDRHDLALAAPIGGQILVEDEKGNSSTLNSDRVILQETDIRSIYVRYQPLATE